MKKNRIPYILVGLVMIIGLGMLAYPTVSDYVNSLSHSYAISSFEDDVAELDEESYQKYLEAAIAFNEELAAESSHTGKYTEKEQQEYENLLNLSHNGIMGYVEVPDTDIRLAIYHGTSDSALNAGTGHLEGTSLPVGGESTHTVITGHRGLPSAKLFTDIDQLVEGDIFTIHVLNEVLTYEVDQIDVVLPSEVNDLKIIKGEDYATLITCTPYGINTHRLLVRGHRIPTPENSVQGIQRIPPFNLPSDLNTALILMITILAVAVVILAGLIIRFRMQRKEKKNEENKKNGGNGMPSVPGMPSLPGQTGESL